MKNLLKILLCVFILPTGMEIKPAPFDTGMITLRQPNDITFTGRIWGDEFIYWMETEDGYLFVETFEGWYYYATLDQNGEYAPTNYKVGIDSPLVSSYKLVSQRLISSKSPLNSTESNDLRLKRMQRFSKISKLILIINQLIEK